MKPTISKYTAIFSTSLIAFVWGVMWYPLRALADSGASAAAITFAIYVMVSIFGVTFFWRTLWREFNFQPILLPLLFLFGWTNFSYSWAMTEGHVMRVLLLFYLSPLWSAIFSRWLLKERLSKIGFLVIGLSLLGCAITLYQPEGGAWFTHRYEWLAITGGMAFALGSVLSRKNHSVPIALKSATIWFGVAVMSGFTLAINHQFHDVLLFTPFHIVIILALGVTLLCTSVLAQHNITAIPVNQIMSIMLLELVFAAITAFYLAGEVVSMKEWIGGSLIVAASLLSDKMIKPKEEAA